MGKEQQSGKAAEGRGVSEGQGWCSADRDRGGKIAKSLWPKKGLRGEKFGEIRSEQKGGKHAILRREGRVGVTHRSVMLEV